MKNLLRVILIGFFVLPALHIFFYFDFWGNPFSGHFLQTLSLAGGQALISMSLCLWGGFIGALGLLAIRQYWPQWSGVAQGAALVPGFLPPILVVTLSIEMTPAIPFGLPGVVFFHGLMNLGLASVMFEQIVLRKSGRWMEMAAVEGVSFRHFIYRGLLPNIHQEILVVGLFFFVLFFTSFSIPFLIGGALYGGIEVFIYEMIFLYGDWGRAASLCVFAFFLLLGAGALLRGSPSPNRQPLAPVDCRLLGWWWGLTVALGPLFFLLLSLGLSLMKDQLMITVAELPVHQLAKASLLLGLGTGFFTILVLIMMIYCNFSEPTLRLLLFALPPSWMVVAFSFFLLPGDHIGYRLLKTMSALTIVFLPFLYRLGFYQSLRDLRLQVAVAQVTGQSWSKIFLHVVLPQLLPIIAFLGGLAGVWAAGDFAMGSVLLTGDHNLALTMKSLLMNYRLQMAHQLVLPMLLVLIVVFGIFQGLGYVARRKTL